MSHDVKAHLSAQGDLPAGHSTAGKQSLADVARRSSVEEIVEERAADLLIFDLDSGGSCSPSLSKGRQVREMLASSADFCDNWRASVNS